MRVSKADMQAVKLELGLVNIDILEEINKHKQEMKPLLKRQLKLKTWVKENK
jgi:hypothetical protein